MAKIPLFTNQMVVSRQTPDLVDPGAIQRAGATARSIGRMSEGFAELAYKQSVAEETTKTNLTIIESKKEKLDLMDIQREKNLNNPEGFARNFAKELQSFDSEKMKDLPSSRAKEAYKMSAIEFNNSIYRKDLVWQNNRQAEINAENLLLAKKNIFNEAYKNGEEGLGIDDIYKQIEATSVAASTTLSPEQATKNKLDMRQEATSLWLEGVAKTEPSKAIQLMDLEETREKFFDQKDFIKLRKSFESREKRLEKQQESLSRVNSLVGENSLLPQVGKMSFTELQNAFGEFGMSPKVQAYFMQANGYASDKSRLTQEERISFKTKTYEILSMAMREDRLNDADLRTLQDSIYVAMTKNALDKKEGFGLLNDLMTPLLEKKKEVLDDFESGEYNLFRTNFGFSQLEFTMKKMLGSFPADSDDRTNQQQFAINKTKNKMYDLYLSSLLSQAKKKKIPVFEIQNLDYAEQSEIYKKALRETVSLVNFENFPEIATMTKEPNALITKTFDKKGSDK
jgi:hypothetical protein